MSSKSMSMSLIPNSALPIQAEEKVPENHSFEYFLFGTEKSILSSKDTLNKWTCSGDYRQKPPTASQIRPFGEDHCFFRYLSRTETKQCFMAVSDGVSSTKESHGTSSAHFSHELIRSAHYWIDAQDQTKKAIIPVGEMTRKIWKTTQSVAETKPFIRGGATFSLVHIIHQKEHLFSVSASILGDSRFGILFFDKPGQSSNILRCTVKYISPQQTHQKATVEGRFPPFQFSLWNKSPESSQVAKHTFMQADDDLDPLNIYVQACPEDVVLVASDGFWDNLMLMGTPSLALDRNDEKQTEIQWKRDQQTDHMLIQKGFDKMFSSSFQLSFSFKDISSFISSSFLQWVQSSFPRFKKDDISCVMVSLQAS